MEKTNNQKSIFQKIIPYFVVLTPIALIIGSIALLIYHVGQGDKAYGSFRKFMSPKDYKSYEKLKEEFKGDCSDADANTIEGDPKSEAGMKLDEIVNLRNALHEKYPKIPSKVKWICRESDQRGFVYKLKPKKCYLCLKFSRTK